jgi:hypothetical protein
VKTCLALSAATLIGVAITAQAAPIPGLFNTGVNNAGVPLADDSLEQHYTLVSQPNSYSANVIRNSHGGPIPPWIPDDGVSAWISPADASTVALGTYDYRLTFDLLGTLPATASISGKWATDNSGEILINGASTGNTSFDLTSFTPFSITIGFVAHLNTLDFVVDNTNCASFGCFNPSGVRVELTGSIEPVPPVPEPSSLFLLSFGIVIVGWFRCRPC